VRGAAEDEGDTWTGSPLRRSLARGLLVGLAVAGGATVLVDIGSYEVAVFGFFLGALAGPVGLVELLPERRKTLLREGTVGAVAPLVVFLGIFLALCQGAYTARILLDQDFVTAWGAVRHMAHELSGFLREPVCLAFCALPALVAGALVVARRRGLSVVAQLALVLALTELVCLPAMVFVLDAAKDKCLAYLLLLVPLAEWRADALEARVFGSQFQGFCRDLHSEAVDHLVGYIAPATLRTIAHDQLISSRTLDRGSPTPGHLGADFGRFGIEFWPALIARAPSRNEWRRRMLDELAVWRNAIAHQVHSAGPPRAEE